MCALLSTTTVQLLYCCCTTAVPYCVIHYCTVLRKAVLQYCAVLLWFCTILLWHCTVNVLHCTMQLLYYYCTTTYDILYRTAVNTTSLQQVCSVPQLQFCSAGPSLLQRCPPGTHCPGPAPRRDARPPTLWRSGSATSASHSAPTRPVFAALGGLGSSPGRAQ